MTKQTYVRLDTPTALLITQKAQEAADLDDIPRGYSDDPRRNALYLSRRWIWQQISVQGVSPFRIAMPEQQDWLYKAEFKLALDRARAWYRETQSKVA